MLLSNWIGGLPTPPQGGDYLDDLEPATGRLLARIPRSSPSDLQTAVDAAQTALTGPWASWDLPARAAFLDRVADLIDTRAEDLAQAESRDTGKPISLTRSLDIPRSAANFRFFAGAARHDHQACFPMPHALNYTLRRRIGIVGLITPWNLPLYLLTWKVAPALAMGNAILAKPSEFTPLTADLLASLLHDAGLPPGVFNLLHGDGAQIGHALVAHPAIRALSFTGGTSTGAKVASTAAPLFKKLSLELGGKNPTLVFADCDLPSAVSGAVRSAFTNQGQVCLAGSRIFVQRPIYDAFLQAFLPAVSALTVGDPADPTSLLGSLISHDHLRKIERYVAQARDEGGTILTGGHRPPMTDHLQAGAFYLPTVIAGLSPQSPVACEEIFGPVVTLHPFDTDDEALSYANAVRYGLSASLWTTNLARAHRLAAALDAGLVWVNTWLLRDLRTPFGGFKDSGIGREGGSHSLDFFSEIQTICISLASSSSSSPALASFPQSGKNH